MKKLAFALTLASALTSTLAQSPFNQADIDAARAAGAQAAGAYSGSFEVDQNGNLVLDANGQPKAVQRSAESLKGDLRKFQADSGMSGVEQTASPGHAARKGEANISVNQNFTFSCKEPAGTVYGAGVLGFRIDQCEVSGSSVQAVRFSVCDAPAKAGTCGSAGDFSKKVRAVAGQYSAFNGMQLGLGCNSVGTCQMTVTGVYTVGGNEASLRAQSEAAANESNAIADLRKTMTEGDYAGKFLEVGEPLVNGSSEPPAGSPTAGREICAATPTCLQEASTTSTFTKSCVRSFPVTVKTEQLQYSDTATCDVTVYQVAVNGKIPAPVSSCDVEPGQPPRGGMVQVGKTAETCSPGDDGAECLTKKHTEYWVNFEQVARSATGANPFPVGGTCDDRVDAETTTVECLNDNWFGRTTAECSVEVVNEGTSAGTGEVYQLSFREKPGCGVCLTPSVNTTCYAPRNAENSAETFTVRDSVCPSDASAFAGCTLRAVTDVTASSPGGLVISQREVYECMSTTKQCVKWSPSGNDPQCMTTDIALGLDKNTQRPQSNGAFNNAMVNAALVEAVGKGLEAGSTGAIPKVFGGENMRCQRPAGGLGKLLQKNCCRPDLERPVKGNIIKDGCPMEAAELAAARRSSYAHFVGEYCSKKIKFLGMKKCIEYTQSYCVFPGMLPRLVHEQGRVQLQEVVSTFGPGQVQTSPLRYSYYSSLAAGSWTASQAVNGVQFAAWQWPSYCADPQKAAQELANNPESKECPGVVTTWIAACDIATGCGALPDEPLEGSLHWQLKNVDPLQNITTAVSRYGAVTGACSPQSQNCSYTTAGLPVGSGSRAVVSKELTWTLFSREQQGAVNQDAAPYELNNIGDLMFRGHSTPGDLAGPVPASVRLDFSRDGGQTWRQLSVPTDLKGRQITLADSDVTITGYCETATNTCNYTVVGTVAVTWKPWGSAQNPDCSGFTAGQLAVLDFGRMDLSEWLATVLDKAGATSPQAVAAQATQQFQQFNALFQSGKVKSNSPKAVNFARVVPSEGFGPFTAKLAVAGYWPEVTGDPTLDKDRVISVQVEWGDCGVSEFLEQVPLAEGIGFRGFHDYRTPDKENYPCHKPVDTATNIIHKIKLTVLTTNSGKQVRELSVENAWSKFPGANSHNVNVTVEKTAPTPASQVPTAPRAPGR